MRVVGRLCLCRVQHLAACYLLTWNGECETLLASFDQEVCQGGWQGIFPANGEVEVRQCEFGNGYPRCADYDCEGFFSEWGECNRFCSGGNESRTYVVPPGDPDAVKYDAEVRRFGHATLDARRPCMISVLLLCFCQLWTDRSLRVDRPLCRFARSSLVTCQKKWRTR